MPTSKYIKTNCRVCESTNLEDIISLGDLYLSEFSEDNKKPASYPLSLILCTDCLLLQLKHTAPAKVLYTDNYGYKSGINNTIQADLKNISQNALKKLNSPKGKFICIDIGANDGTLLKNYPKGVFKVGIEPIRKLAEECKKHADVVINDFFSYKAFKKVLDGKKAKIVTAISCFYDIDEPNKFVSDVTKILDENGIFVIQQNYLKSMLELKAFDNIVHEHLEYYSLHSLNSLLKRHNLEVFDVEMNIINGGSFRTYIAFKGKREIEKSVINLLEEERKNELHTKKPYKQFAKEIRNNKRKIVDFIKKEVKKGKKVYVYGASTRGNTLLQYFKLNNKLIAKAVERNPEKWGKKIASLGIPIISEDQARSEKPEYMLVLPWFFKTEFLQREKKYLEAGGHFIFPLPEVEII